MPDDQPKIFFYMGRRLEEYSKEELIEIATEGWTGYLKLMERNVERSNFLERVNASSS